MVPVWSGFVRVLHWALAGSVLLSIATADGGGRLHEWAGYTALAVALLRVAVGFLAASPYVRFSGFVRGPAAVFHYTKSFLAGRAARHLGHNPLGGWMIAALLACVALAGVSGALYVTDAFWGDETVGLIHEYSGWGLLVLAILHVAGVLSASRVYRENLVAAMLHGQKAAEPSPRPGVREPKERS